MRLEERFQNSGDGEFDWRLAGRKRQMAFFVGLGIDQPARRSGALPGPAALRPLARSFDFSPAQRLIT